VSERGRARFARVLLFLVSGWLLYLPAASAKSSEATRQWLLEHWYQALSSPLDLGLISSMLYGLVGDAEAAAQGETRQALGALRGALGTVDRQRLDCGDLVNLRFIGSFLEMNGVAFEVGALDSRLHACLDEMKPFDRASLLFSLCRFPSDTLPREKLAQAIKSIEDLQQADGGFGSSHGLQRYYLSTHAVFALHSCEGNPHVVRRGQLYLRNGLPQLRQLGFVDGVLESLIMLRKMGVDIPQQRLYTDYVRSKIKQDGSVCFFDHPGCRSDPHATSLLLEFLREFGN